MAANDSPISEALIKEKLQDNGHDIRYDFELINPAALFQGVTFSRVYNPACARYETSWLFHMSLLRNQGENKVSGSAHLLRNDSLRVDLPAHFVLEFRHQSFYHEIGPKEPMLKTLLPTEQKEAIFDIKLPGDMKDIIDRKIKVSISIAVRRCHTKRRKSYSRANNAAKRKTMQCSKI